MARFKRGDRVVIVERETTAADRKSGLYYPHFRGLEGVVDQIYEPQGEICVEVEQTSLPPEFLRRHQTIESQARQKWLNSISEQERRSLSDEQKRLRLKYTVMVSPEDVAPAGRSRAPKPAADAASQSAPAPASPAVQAVPAAGPLPEGELTPAEAAHLAEVLRRAKKE